MIQVASENWVCHTKTLIKWEGDIQECKAQLKIDVRKNIKAWASESIAITTIMVELIQPYT